MDSQTGCCINIVSANWDQSSPPVNPSSLVTASLVGQGQYTVCANSDGSG